MRCPIHGVELNSANQCQSCVNESVLTPMKSSDLEKKAFWAGFERARMMPDEYDIQKHWHEYKALEV